METVMTPGDGEVDRESFARLLRHAGLAEGDTASMLAALDALLSAGGSTQLPPPVSIRPTSADEGADKGADEGADEGIDWLLAHAASTGADAAAAMAAHVAAIDDTITAACRTPEAFVGPNWRRLKDAVEFARRSAVCELATMLRVSESTVNSQALLAHTLRTQLPLTWAAFREGSLSYSKAGIIADQAEALAGQVSAETMAELDAALLAAARRLTPAKLRQKAKGVRERLHPEPAVDRHAAAMRARRVWVNPELDGMAWLNALLPAEIAQGAFARIDAAAHNLAGLPDEQRTLDQLRADAAGDILTAAGTPNEVRAVVNVTVPVLALIGEGGQRAADAPTACPAGSTFSGDAGADATTACPAGSPSRATGMARPLLNLVPAGAASRIDPAILEGYGPIDPETARRLTGNATTLYRVLVDPIDGATITVDRKKYRPPADLKRLVKARFATCSFPGCSRPAERCDLDHTDPFDGGGDTCAENLAPLCRHHHGVKHKTAWVMNRTPDASVQWISPRGVTHDTDPPPF